MLDVLRKNFGLKLFSVTLAIAAWAYFRFAAAPSLTAQFDQQLSVPITVVGLRAGYAARITGEKQAVVTVVQPRNGVAIRPDQVKAVANVTGSKAGVLNVALQIIGPNLEITSIVPASVNLIVDALVERAFPIIVAYTGDRRDLVVSGVDVTPSNVIMRGTADDLARLNEIRVEIPFPQNASVYDAMVRPAIRAQPATDTSAITFSPSLVRVRADFQKGTGTQR